MTALTEKQQEILDFVGSFINSQGLAPTVQEIQREFGFKSPNAVQSHLKALQNKGVITRNGHRARALRILTNEQGQAPSEIENPQSALGQVKNEENVFTDSVKEEGNQVLDVPSIEFSQPVLLDQRRMNLVLPGADKKTSGSLGWLRRVRNRARSVACLEDVSVHGNRPSPIPVEADIPETMGFAMPSSSVAVLDRSEGDQAATPVLQDQVAPIAESLPEVVEQAQHVNRTGVKVSEMGLDVFFNAKHMTSNELNGEIHSHSWRLRVVVRTAGSQNEPGLGLEQIRQLLQEVVTPLDGAVLNNLPQFTTLEPTIERVAESLGYEIKESLQKVNLELVNTTLWDQPTQYITTWESEPYHAA